MSNSNSNRDRVPLKEQFNNDYSVANDYEVDNDDDDGVQSRGVEIDYAIPGTTGTGTGTTGTNATRSTTKKGNTSTVQFGSKPDTTDTGSPGKQQLGLSDTATGTGVYAGPVDLDDLFNSNRNLRAYNNAAVGKSKTEQVMLEDDDDNSLFGDDDGDEESAWKEDPNRPTYFTNPHKRLLDRDASLIPGSPFSKPSNKASNRPGEPLAIAKYASTLSYLLTMGWIAALIIVAAWQKFNAGRMAIEILLSLLSFFGLFWNSYFLISSILKCFIPAAALKSNTKYASIIPETKPPDSEWLQVTIQIPVYKESLHEVMMPTLKSCIAAREHYIQNTGGSGRCNIVISDDGMMAYLRDNFPAAEMLWENICQTKGQVIRLSKLLKHVPRASRRHLKGLRSKNVYEVFHRMLFYYHYNIGFVGRSTVDRRGKFKKASNLNSHLRLSLGASQLANDSDGTITFQEALLTESHNDDGSRYIMFGNDIELGHLICINDADARMAESVIYKTVPEFLNDKTLGFTQHATKTMNEQRGESYYTNLLTVYTDALYQGHFLLSSILGCHPPLVGHSIFLRTEALNQVGKMRTLRKAQQWLRNIGLQFLPVDQVGFSNLQAQNRLEYWSECHVSEDFELMIHLYNLGFNGRYCAYPDCEFQEGITRTFDEEAGRHRKFALGAHELVFNPFSDMLGKGIFTQLFRTFLVCDIPSYYKIFLTAYLCSYTSGGAYIIVFTVAAITRLVDAENEIKSLSFFSPAGIIILNFVIYYVFGYFTFLVAMLRMNYINNKLLFPEYRKKYFSSIYIIFVHLRYSLVFQMLFYNVACFTFYFLGSMDHMLSRPGIVGATNKDSISISRCTAFIDMVKFNSGSWGIAFVMAGLAYLTVLQDNDMDFTQAYPKSRAEWLYHGLFALPAMFLAFLCFIVPIILNPWILGWPFLRANKPKAPSNIPEPKRTGPSLRNLNYNPNNPPTNTGFNNKNNTIYNTNNNNGNNNKREVVTDLNRFMNTANALDSAIKRASNKPDVELGSLATKELGGFTVAPIGANNNNNNTNNNNRNQPPSNNKQTVVLNQNKQKQREDEYLRVQGIPVNSNNNTNNPIKNKPSRDSSLDRGYPGQGGVILQPPGQQQGQQQGQQRRNTGGNNNNNNNNAMNNNSNRGNNNNNNKNQQQQMGSDQSRGRC